MDEPRNPILRIDLAWLYTILGLSAKAVQHLEIALSLAPSNRFVVRSAARFFVHEGDPERALRALRRAHGVRSDPWLLATEIGVSSILGRPSRLLRTGVALLEGRTHSPSSTAELASAIASAELEAGHDRKSKALFRTSLIQPNENAVAQAEWASEKMRARLLEERHFAVPLSFEAIARESHQRGDWRASLDAAEQWLGDQPFSSQPAVHGSYVASVCLADFAKAKLFIENGLRANERDVVLLNNLAFVLASENQLDAAEQAFERIDQGRLNNRQRIAITATRGLLAFRRGRIEEGREEYLAAIDLARNLGLAGMKALAAVFLAREEIVAGAADAKLAVRRAEELAREIDRPDVSVSLRRVQELAGKTLDEPHVPTSHTSRGEADPWRRRT